MRWLVGVSALALAHSAFAQSVDDLAPPQHSAQRELRLWVHGASTVGGCPFSSSTDTSLCANSPGGTTQHSTFFTGYAQQSSQTWTAIRPQWNVAGVDYAVGYYGSLTAINSANLTGTGCSLGTGEGVPAVICSGSGQALDLKGIDFTGRRLDISADTYSSVTIEDSNLVVTSAVNSAADFALIRLNDSGVTTSTVNFLSDTIQGMGTTTDNIGYLVKDARNAPNTATVVKYVACLYTGGKCFTPTAVGGGNSFTVKASYIEQINGQGGGHAEPWQWTGSGTITAALMDDEFNTFLQPSTLIITGIETFAATASSGPGASSLTVASPGPDNTVANQAVLDYTAAPNAPIPQFTRINSTGTNPGLTQNVVSPGVSNGDSIQFAVGGADGFESWGPTIGVLTITTQTASNNVYVANKWSQFTGFQGISKIMDGGPNATTLNIRNNWVDPTGAGACFVMAGTYGTTNMSGNINALNGNTIVSLTGTCP